MRFRSNRLMFLASWVTLAPFSLSAAPAERGSAPQTDVPVKLVFVHGRAQEGKDPALLEREWTESLKRGAAAAGRALPNVEIEFPYYGDKLDELARAYEVPLTADIQAKGAMADREFLEFQAAWASEVARREGITDDQINAEYGADPRERGPQNWKWVQAILRAIDKHAQTLSQSALEAFMRDVFLYTKRAGVRQEVDRIVSGAFTDEPAVVVGHSLGSVVAYSVLGSDPRSLQVPLYVSVGSPLAIRSIRNEFRPLRFPAPIGSWYNAFDDRDVVALYPLDGDHFPVTPAILNYGGVSNHTPNRHGIAGYLEDPQVAARILDALGARGGS